MAAGPSYNHNKLWMRLQKQLIVQKGLLIKNVIAEIL